mgnify:CR=1 FL=1
MHSNLVIDLGKIFRLFSGDSEISPFHDYYANEQTLLRNCSGRLFVHYNGEDLVRTYWALRKKAIICDTPERPLEISGPDSVTFLQMIFSRDVSKLKVGRGFYTISCTHSGGTFMDGILFKLSDDKFWFVQPDGDMATWMLAHSNGFAINIRDPKSRVLQVQGPKSYEIMHATSKGVIDHNFGYYHSGFFRIGEQQVYVSRTGWTGELGYEIYLRDGSKGSELWEKIMEAGREFNLKPGHTSSIRRIEGAMLSYHADADIKTNPFELGLDRLVNLDSDISFIGKESLRAIKQKGINRIQVGLELDCDPLKGPNTLHWPVKVGSQVIGKITSAVYSPRLEKNIALAMVDINHSQLANEVDIEIDDMLIKGSVVHKPFFDPKKEITKKSL